MSARLRNWRSEIILFVWSFSEGICRFTISDNFLSKHWIQSRSVVFFMTGKGLSLQAPKFVTEVDNFFKS